VALCRYLQIEWDLKKAPTEGPRSFDKPTMKGATPGCPQQSNSSDCGVYVLQYIESFFQVRLSTPHNDDNDMIIIVIIIIITTLGECLTSTSGDSCYFYSQHSQLLYSISIRS